MERRGGRWGTGPSFIMTAYDHGAGDRGSRVGGRLVGAAQMHNRGG